jgi:hypothetical protein
MRANVNLPDPTAILPYLGLFTLVVLDPEELEGQVIGTTHLPDLSILQNRHFIPAPTNTSPTVPNAARIFDALAVVSANPPKQRGHIPLCSQDPEFQQQRYWRLPTQIGVILAGLIARVGFCIYSCEESRLAQYIWSVLALSGQGMTVSRYRVGSGRSGGDGEPSDDVGGGSAGPSGDLSSSGSDRKRGPTEASGPAAKKRRKDSESEAGDGDIEEGESEYDGEGGELPLNRN